MQHTPTLSRQGFQRPRKCSKGRPEQCSSVLRGAGKIKTKVETKNHQKGPAPAPAPSNCLVFSLSVLFFVPRLCKKKRCKEEQDISFPLVVIFRLNSFCFLLPKTGVEAASNAGRGGPADRHAPAICCWAVLGAEKAGDAGEAGAAVPAAKALAPI